MISLNLLTQERTPRIPQLNYHNLKPNPPPTPKYQDLFCIQKVAYKRVYKPVLKSVIGKIITDKHIHVNSIQNGLDSIWGAPQGLKIQEIGGKWLQFFMNNVTDQERILQGNPWIFRNSWLVVKPWDMEIDLHDLDFDNVPIWIQLWGLPPPLQNKKNGGKHRSPSRSS
jgi:hypothetical protein